VLFHIITSRKEAKSTFKIHEALRKMTGSGLPHEPPSFINPRVPLDLHGIANHPTQQAFFTAGIKALDASPLLGGDDIPKQVYQTGKLSLRPAKPPERKFKVEEERRREREQKETEERRKQRMIKRRRMRTFGSAIVGGVFGVLFTALRKKQSIRKKR
jgi:hypothetical protein